MPKLVKSMDSTLQQKEMNHFIKKMLLIHGITNYLISIMNDERLNMISLVILNQ